MSVIKYIGRQNYFKGKTLWEIVGNLKDYGVGRIVVRSVFERYPEISYLKIKKVECDANDIIYIKHSSGIDVPQNLRKVRVWVEKVFRGKKIPGDVFIYRTSYKADYRLIPKDEEEKYTKVSNDLELRHVTPYIEYPPLFKELVLKDLEKKGIEPPKDMRLVTRLRKNRNNVTEPDLDAKETIGIKYGQPGHPEYFKLPPSLQNQ